MDLNEILIQTGPLFTSSGGRYMHFWERRKYYYSSPLCLFPLIYIFYQMMSSPSDIERETIWGNSLNWFTQLSEDLYFIRKDYEFWSALSTQTHLSGKILKSLVMLVTSREDNWVEEGEERDLRFTVCTFYLFNLSTHIFFLLKKLTFKINI